jgi:hypothetical protein
MLPVAKGTSTRVMQHSPPTSSLMERTRRSMRAGDSPEYESAPSPRVLDQWCPPVPAVTRTEISAPE